MFHTFNPNTEGLAKEESGIRTSLGFIRIYVNRRKGVKETSEIGSLSSPRQTESCLVQAPQCLELGLEKRLTFAT